MKSEKKKNKPERQLFFLSVWSFLFFVLGFVCFSTCLSVLPSLLNSQIPVFYRCYVDPEYSRITDSEPIGYGINMDS